MGMENASDKPKDPTRRAFFQGAATGGAAMFAGSVIGEGLNQTRAETEKGPISIDHPVMREVLKQGGSVKIELKLDPETGQSVWSGEAFDSQGKFIPGGYLKS